MPYSPRMQKNHLYSVFFAPRGYRRLAEAGMHIAQQYLSPFDKLIGLIGPEGSGKSVLITGMFPGLDLTNDDMGVNVRPLPLLSVGESSTGFYTPNTYHVDIRFELAFTQMHELAAAILEAMRQGKRVVVEHFELIYPALGHNAHLLIGLGSEILLTRPTLFGPQPQDIHDVVYPSFPYRRMIHTAEDLCEFALKKLRLKKYEIYEHSDVRHGFVLSFTDKPDIDIPALRNDVLDMISRNIPISYKDDMHIMIGEHEHVCTGPRMHVKNTGEIENFTLLDELLFDPISKTYMLIGLVGNASEQRISDLNQIIGIL